MSISPQSLARTRDKRSLRIPARYDDFSDIPNEVTLRSASETKTRPTKRQSSTNSCESPEPSAKKPSNHPSAPATPSTTPPEPTSSTNTAAGTSKRPPPRQRSSTPAVSADVTPEEDIIIKEEPPTEETPRKTPEVDEPEVVEFKIEESAPSEPISDKTEIDEDLDLPPTTTIDSPPRRASKSKASPEGTKKTTEPPKEERADPAPAGNNPKPSSKSKASKSQLTEKPTLKSKSQNQEATTKKTEDTSIIKKSPFHPSITITSGARVSGQPLSEKKLSLVDFVNSPTPQPPTPPKSSRKKSKGSSLIKPASGSFQTTGNAAINNGNIINNRSNNVQQSRYYYATPTVQYGARYLANEPILIPQSVAPIAPITVTVQDIVNKFRSAPFISKKAEVCIAYQDKINHSLDSYMANYKALVKITSYLNHKDLLNLRLVNKSWKSIVDSDVTWERVTLNTNDKIWWPLFSSEILRRYRTKTLHLNEYSPEVSEPASEIFSRLVDTNVKYLKLTTKTPLQNQFAMELISSLTSVEGRFSSLRVHWEVKVNIDDVGVALVWIQMKNPQSLSSDDLEKFHCYRTISNLFGDPDECVLVELCQLQEALVPSEGKATQAGSSSRKPLVTVKPI